jgi:hypothetical protein
MLQKVVAEESVTYTDLSPSPGTTRINEKLGFRVASEGVLLFFLPWTAIAGPTELPVLPFEELPAGSLSSRDRSILAYHRDLGCIAAAVRADDRYWPLLFNLTRRRGVPVARLVLADSRPMLTRAVGSIARFLLRRRVLFLTLHANADQMVPSGMMWNRSAPVQVKGTWDLSRVDHTFSELVLLQL